MKKINILVTGAGSGVGQSIIRSLTMSKLKSRLNIYISDISKREEFRKFSYVSLRADYVIMGKGLEGYIEALEKMQREH